MADQHEVHQWCDEQLLHLKPEFAATVPDRAIADSDTRAQAVRAALKAQADKALSDRSEQEAAARQRNAIPVMASRATILREQARHERGERPAVVETLPPIPPGCNWTDESFAAYQEEQTGALSNIKQTKQQTGGYALI